MQKKLIAVAIAAALAPAAAMADTTVYGRIHTSIDNISGVTQQNSTSVNSSSSRFGVKGSEDLGNGLKAVYQLESGITSTGQGNDGNGTAANNSLFTNQRDTYVGLAGNFGTFLAGRLPGANQYVYDSNLFGDQIGDAATFTAGGSLAGLGGRANGALHYVAPAMSGLTAALTYLPADSVVGNNTAASASWGVKLNYANAGVGVNFAYFDVDGGANEFKPMSLAGSYDFGNGMISAQYVRDKKTVVATGVATTQNAYNIGGQFNVNANSAIKAQYSKANDVTNTTTTGASMFAIGYDYNLSKRTGVYVAYAAVSNEAAATYRVDNWGHGNRSAAPTGGQDPKGFSVGLTHNF